MYRSEGFRTEKLLVSQLVLYSIAVVFELSKELTGSGSHNIWRYRGDAVAGVDARAEEAVEGYGEVEVDWTRSSRSRKRRTRSGRRGAEVEKQQLNGKQEGQDNNKQGDNHEREGSSSTERSKAKGHYRKSNGSGADANGKGRDIQSKSQPR